MTSLVPRRAPASPSPGAPTQVVRTFSPTVDSPRLARHFVVESLEQLDDPELSGTAALVVTELATNAVGHAKSPFTVTVLSEAGRVCLSVRDDSQQEPAIRCQQVEAITGRGLRLVAGLADSWGVHRRGNGKEIWAELRS